MSQDWGYNQAPQFCTIPPIWSIGAIRHDWGCNQAPQPCTDPYFGPIGGISQDWVYIKDLDGIDTPNPVAHPEFGHVAKFKTVVRGDDRIGGDRYRIGGVSTPPILPYAPNLVTSCRGHFYGPSDLDADLKDLTTSRQLNIPDMAMSAKCFCCAALCFSVLSGPSYEEIFCFGQGDHTCARNSVLDMLVASWPWQNI